ncbi:MAG: hypothetical protein JOZ73_05600 [Solirubrobacterales bacterium]|nr:hypothetical protein [Solirubrobacterales bacterium]
MLKNVRNVVIVLVLAALVVLIPGGGKGASTAIAAVSLAFLGAAAWVAYVLYRQNRMWLDALGDQRRAALYAAAGLALLDAAAYGRLTATGAGTIAFIALLGVAGYVIFAVVWSARRY